MKRTDKTLDKLDNIIRESLSKKLQQQNSTPVVKKQFTLEDVILEALKHDVSTINEQRTFNAKNISDRIYNAKGVWDDEAAALAAIKSIKNAEQWFAVENQLNIDHDKNLNQYLSSFLSTEDLDIVSKKLSKILPQTSYLKFISDRIYNAKGVVWDDENDALAAIKSIKNAKQWDIVKNQFETNHEGRNLQNYLNSFLKTRQLDQVVNHLLSIFPNNRWKSETSTLKSLRRPFDPKTGKERLGWDTQKTPEKYLKGKHAKIIDQYIDKPIIPSGVVQPKVEIQKQLLQQRGIEWNPTKMTRAWENSKAEQFLKNMGAEMALGGNRDANNTFERVYSLLVYSNPKVEKTGSRDRITFTENKAAFSNFPGQEYLWKIDGKAIKLYMPNKPIDPEGKIVKQASLAIWIDNLVSIGGQQYRVDDSGTITTPGQRKRWDDPRRFRSGSDVLDELQTLFDWIGLIPVIGDAVDIINAVIYFSRGKTLEGFLSLIAVIPYVGTAAAIPVKAAYKNLRRLLVKYKATKILQIQDPIKRSAEFKRVFQDAILKEGPDGKSAKELLKMVSNLDAYQKGFRQWRVSFIKKLQIASIAIPMPGVYIMYKSTDEALRIAEREFNAFCKEISKSANEVIEASTKSSTKSAVGQTGKEIIKGGTKEMIKDVPGWWARNSSKLINLITKTSWRLPKSVTAAQANAIGKWFRQLVVSNDQVWKNIIKTMPVRDANKLVTSFIFNERYYSNVAVNTRTYIRYQLGLTDRLGKDLTKLGEAFNAGTASFDELFEIITKATRLDLYKNNLFSFKNAIADKAMEIGNVVYKEFIQTWWVGFLTFIKRDVAFSLPYWKTATNPTSKYLPTAGQLWTAWAPEWGNIWKLAKRSDVIYNEYQDVWEKYGFEVDTPNSVLVSILYHIFSYSVFLDKWLTEIIQAWQKSDAGQNDKIEAAKELIGADRLKHGELPSKLREPVKYPKP